MYGSNASLVGLGNNLGFFPPTLGKCDFPPAWLGSYEPGPGPQGAQLRAPLDHARWPLVRGKPLIRVFLINAKLAP